MSKIVSHAHDMRMRLLNPSYDFLWKTALFLPSVPSLIRLSAVPNKVFVNLLFPQNILPKLFVSLSTVVVGFKKWSVGLVPLWHAIFCWFQFSIRFQNSKIIWNPWLFNCIFFSHSQFLFWTQVADMSCPPYIQQNLKRRNRPRVRIGRWSKDCLHSKQTMYLPIDHKKKKKKVVNDCNLWFVIDKSTCSIFGHFYLPLASSFLWFSWLKGIYVHLPEKWKPSKPIISVSTRN